MLKQSIKIFVPFNVYISSICMRNSVLIDIDEFVWESKTDVTECSTYCSDRKEHLERIDVLPSQRHGRGRSPYLVSTSSILIPCP